MTPSKQPRSRDRRVPKRTLKQVVHFVCEGDTEEKYIRALSQILQLKNTTFKVRNTSRDGTSWKNLVAATRKLETGSGEPVWIIADVDHNANHGHKDTLIQWVRSGAGNNACISNPCIESWFLLHFEAKRTRNASDAEMLLKSFWPTYRKNSNPRVLESQLGPCTEKAAKNAIKLNMPSSEEPVIPASGNVQFLRLLEFLRSYDRR